MIFVLLILILFWTYNLKNADSIYIMSLGKKRYIIDQTSVSGAVADSFREYVGSIWFANENKNTLNYRKKNFPKKISKFNISTTERGNMNIKETITFNVNDYATDSDGLEREHEIVSYLDNLVSNTYSDHYFEYNTPFNSDEQLIINSNTLSMNGNVDFIYNFYDRVYENKTNIMSVATLQTVKNVFDLYQPIEIKNPGATPEMLFLSPLVLENISDMHPISDDMPMYTEISFDTDGVSSFSEKLQNIDYTTALYLQIMISMGFSPTDATAALLQESTFYSVTEFDDGRGTSISNIGSANYTILDLQTALQNVDLSSTDFSNVDTIQVYDIDNTEKGFGSSPTMSVSAMFAKIILNGFLNNKIDDNMRSYNQILNGMEAFQETIFYEMEKFEDDQLIETWVIPNTVDTSLNNMIDRKVRYDKNYRYVFYAYKMVIGSKYEFKRVPAPGQGQRFKLEVLTTPSVKVMKLPYFVYEGNMIDSPSIAPEVDIIPYKGIDNRLLFLFNSPIGDYEKQPTIVSLQDQKMIQKYRSAASLGPGTPIHYRTDDPPIQISVYRLTKLPTSYRDFDGNKIYEVSTTNSQNTGEYSNNASVVDSVSPGTKYYYMFRSIDVHGNLSDVSDVFQVQLINDGNSIYLDTEVIEIDPIPNTTQPTRTFRRMLQIKPSYNQITLDNQKISSYTTSYDVQSGQYLGIADESLWRQRFKIRLISKKTGRKIDINVRFKQSIQVAEGEGGFTLEMTDEPVSSEPGGGPDGYS